MAKLGQFARPVMGCAARLDADEAGLQLGEERQPQKQQRIFVRREPAPGEPGANGWALEDAARHRLQAAGQRPSLYDLGLYESPQEPCLNATGIPPPPDPPDNETLFAHLAPGAWARALSAEGADTIRAVQIRKVTYVGLQTTYMLCAWEQKIGPRWRRLSQYADISRVNDNVVALKDARQYSLEIGEPSRSRPVRTFPPLREYDNRDHCRVNRFRILWQRSAHQFGARQKFAPALYS
jgi:hypothetical protein